MKTLHPALAEASYNEAHALWRNGTVTGDDIREWFPRWCVGKCEYAVVDGRACEARYDGNVTTWHPIAWIENRV